MVMVDEGQTDRDPDDGGQGVMMTEGVMVMMKGGEAS